MDAGEWFRWAAAFVLGALSAVVIEFARGQFERLQRRADRREDFQQQTLLALQDAVSARAVVTLSASKSARTGQEIGSEAENALILAAIETQKLVARVADSRTRDLAEQFLGATADAAYPNADADHDKLIERVSSAALAVNDRIGELLRKA